MKIAKILVILAGIVIIGAPALYFAGPPVYKFFMLFSEQRKLNGAEEKWADYAYRDYVIDVRAGNNHCLYAVPNTYRVLVIDDRVVSIYQLDEPGRVFFSDYCLSNTFTSIFHSIQHSIDARFDVVAVKYDDELGYPRDVNFNADGIDDSAFSWEVLNFTLDLDTFEGPRSQAEWQASKS